MFLSHKIKENYRGKINRYIERYRELEYEDDDGREHEYDILEDAYYDDCYETVSDLFEEAMRDAFYYGLALGLEKPKVIKNE